MPAEYAQRNDNLGTLVLDLVADPRIQRLAMKWAVRAALSAAGAGALHYIVVPALFGDGSHGDEGADSTGELSLLD